MRPPWLRAPVTAHSPRAPRIRLAGGDALTALFVVSAENSSLERVERLRSASAFRDLDPPHNLRRRSIDRVEAHHGDISEAFKAKLAGLNASSQSIEPLSHWCVFHRKKAKDL